MTSLDADFEKKATAEKIWKLSKRPNPETEALDARQEIFEKIRVIVESTSKHQEHYPDVFLDAQMLNLEFHKIKPIPKFY